jgi:ComF family protein
MPVLLVPPLLVRLLHVTAGLLAELVAPSVCAACDAPLRPGSIFCAPCAASLLPLSRGRSAAFEYGGALATAIGRMKYEDRPDLARGLGQAMIPMARDAGADVELVVPVPLHPKRLAERGYNQAALLAAEVARALALPHRPDAVRRVRDTPRQASLDRAARLVNLQGAFSARARVVQGRRLLLVDDVWTTGATLESCSAALRTAGAAEVQPLVLAHKH